MKRNIRNLVVIAIITVIMPFILAAMASASGNDSKAIHGEYAATSVVSCNNYKEDGTTFDYSSTVSQLSIYTFNGDGTGTMQGKFVMIGLAPTPSERTLDMSWEFTYEFADDGTITMDAVPGTGEWKIPGTNFVVVRYTGGTNSDSGRFSVDHKTIVLGTVEPNDTVLTYFDGRVVHTKCNTSRVLIRVDK